MATIVDEYNPSSKQKRYQIQNGDTEFIYNNVRTCIAVAVTDSAGADMVAVHFTIASKSNVQELTQAVQKMKQLLKGQSTGIYLIGPYSSTWKDSLLVAKLRAISHSIFVADVAKVSNTNTGADVDVKMELTGGQVKGYVKPLGSKQYMAVAFKPVG